MISSARWWVPSTDLIIDTGDLTDWGTPLEAEIITRIEELAIPYLFAAGNHEAPDVLARLGQTSNVTFSAVSR